VFQSKEPPAKSTTPEEFIRMTKGITMATAKAVAAGNSGQQEDIIHTANLSRKAIADMLTTCKGGGVLVCGESGVVDGSEWVDPEDPTVVAENELLGAAASIEAAAKKLEQLKPRAKPK
ncbi:hypothetical protein CRUP_027448, partial [Coryphaenoides rupestris]